MSKPSARGTALRPRRRERTVCTVAVSIAAVACVAGMTWAQPAGANHLSPPISLSPADGATFNAGQTVTFRVRGDTGEDPEYLWVHVSRSPAEADACGTIDDDVNLESFKATSERDVFVATLRTGEDEDIDGTGTFYWQVYRIEHEGDADGCIEGPVRSFVVRRSGAAPSPTPRPQPKPKRLPGLYRGATTQGRALSFRLGTSRTRITGFSTSMRFSCFGARATIVMRPGGMDVGRAGSFSKIKSGEEDGVTLAAIVRGKFRSRTRVTGTISFRVAAARSCFRRYSWTARRVGR